MYGDGSGFTVALLPPDMTMLLVGPNPTLLEEKIGHAIITEERSIALTGIDLDRVGKDHVIRCRPKGKHTLPTGKVAREAIAHCRIYDQVPESVQLIVAMGAVALSKYGDGLKIHDWRGHLLPDSEEESDV